MGHAINFFTFPRNVDKNKAYSEIAEWGRCNCDAQEYGGYPEYHGNFKFESEYKIYDSREKAEKYLEGLGSYVDRAVLFYDYTQYKPSAKEIKIQKDMNKLREKAIKWLKEHRLQEQKAQYIKCKKCESKIKTTLIGKRGYEVSFTSLEPVTYGQCCPVCKEDMRANYIIEKEKSFGKQMKILQKKYEDMVKENREKNRKKAVVKWLAKVEVHC